ncbi:hypothetical protein NUSPORA_02981 [Nucleospora cyclopteri]
MLQKNRKLFIIAILSIVVVIVVIAIRAEKVERIFAFPPKMSEGFDNFDLKVVSTDMDLDTIKLGTNLESMNCNPESRNNNLDEAICENIEVYEINKNTNRKRKATEINNELESSSRNGSEVKRQRMYSGPELNVIDEMQE